MSQRQESGSGVHISAGQVYQEVRGLSESVTRLEVKIDSLTERLAAREEVLQDHKDRISSLERKAWTAAGAGAAVGAASGWLLRLV